MRSISILVLGSLIAAVPAVSAPPSSVMTASLPASPAGDLASHSAGGWGIDFSDRDPAVRPGDNFYKWQNGGWFARTELNAELPAAAYWRDLRRLSPRRLSAILEEAAADRQAAPGTATAMAGAFYRAFMNEKLLEEKGLDPLKPELDAIRAAKTRAAMAMLMGAEAGPGTQRSQSVQVTRPRAMFSLDIGQDRKVPDRYVVYLGQAGLLLPGPEFYLDPKLADFKSNYQAYVTRLLARIGWPDAEANAQRIVDFETAVAKVSWSHEAMLDVVKTYNKVTLAELVKLAPDFDWRAFLKGAGLAKTTELVVDAKSAVPRIAKIFADAPIAVLQARQAMAAVEAESQYLDAALTETVFEFRGRSFTGSALALQARSLRAEAAVELDLPDLLSAFYVQRYFSAEAKARAEEMAVNLKAAFDARLQKLPWMSPETKAKAREKLARMRINVGYPDKFQDYAGLEISDTDLYGDAQRSKAYNWRYLVDKLDKPYDRSAWVQTPNYPNYNYIPTTNTVEIPAALLQPPFFDPRADDAVNYGAVGALIGEMILTAFDGQGRHYDAEGRLREWWSAAEARNFDAQAQRLSAQYSSIEAWPGLYVNGALVVNEAVSDLGAILTALDAYHLSLKGRPAPVLDGTTGDQRIFLGRAQMWRAKFPEAFVRNQIATGANAPPFVRVNGPLPNIDAWYTAFGVKPGDKMFRAPEDRVRIW